MSGGRLLRAAAVATALLVGASPAWAQFSPGPLSRSHSDLEGTRSCTKCHELGLGKGPSDARCLDCHKALAARIQTGRGFHAAGGRNEGCARCHSEHNGRDYDLMGLDRAHFDHAETGYRLSGRHAGLACEKCHKTPRTFLGADPACRACHEDVHTKTLGDDCARCHDETSFKPASRFDHAKTRYPLEGEHATVACASCHRQGRFAGIVFDACDDFHESPHAVSFTQKKSCASCHEVAGWSAGAASGFDHGRTAFPLEGAHAKAACASCHKGGRFASLKGAHCATCHDDVHKGQFAASHPDGCPSCHDVSAWKPSTFDHKKTSFHLDGGHAKPACADCHKDGTFAGVSTACAACHQDPHSGQFAGLACASCHDATTWDRVRFDHRGTSFALNGRHADLACAACHEGGKFKGLSAQCSDCHEDSHLSALGMSCERCHTADAWTPSTFAHGVEVFPAWGGHQAIDCASCHRDEVTWQVDVPPRDCIDCHDEDFRRAPVVVHTQAGPDCERCHSLDEWKGGHDDAWFNIRTGRHRGVSCFTCHDLAPDYFDYTCEPCHHGHTDGRRRCLECHPNGFGGD